MPHSASLRNCPQDTPDRISEPHTLALASHSDLKVIQQMLGHSSIVTTADTYTSVLPETAHRAAQATADMVIKAARSAPGSRLSGIIVPMSRPR
jgi:hypothetical protein